MVHGFLEDSYWARGVPREVVERSVENSLCFGLYRENEQIGFAYLADVFVLEEHRGVGFGKWLVEAALSHPDLRGLRRWRASSADAHGLYRAYGFDEPGKPGIFMEKKDASYGV